MIGAETLEVLDVVLVGSSQQEVALVSQILDLPAINELHHVRDCAEVHVLDVDLVVLARVVGQEHGLEHGGTGAQNGLAIYLLARRST